MELRNIAIIAHVDHGKTTLVDSLLKQSDTLSMQKLTGDTIMDSNDIERERGITIFSKNAAVVYQGIKINIVDTPGHADFGGEVERIMNLVDGALLLVDAKEGPMPQTRFVLKKAIEAGHRIIVVINKIDKPDARPDWVLDKTFDLFFELGASSAQADFPVIYASAKQGKAGVEADLSTMNGVTPLFDSIIKNIPAPKSDVEGPLQVSVVNVSHDNYKGRIAIGRVIRGVFRPGNVVWINRDGKSANAKITNISIFDGLERKEVDEAPAGEIVAFAGVENINIGETIADPANPEALPVMAIEEPTVKMTFGVNTSPMSGKEGQYTTSRNIKERLERELQNDVALRVDLKNAGESFIVEGRGELHLAILIEKMRRDGFELQVSRPQVIFKEVDGKKQEPFEQVEIEVPENLSGVVIEKLGKRRGELKDMKNENGVAFLTFEIPTRGLIGYRNEFTVDTRGQGILNTLLLGYRAYAGDLGGQEHGSLIAHESGLAVTYGMLTAQERGTLFIPANTDVYEGQIVGQNAKPEDLTVNVCKEKRLSNMRSKGDGVAESLTPHRIMSLELALEYIGDDELVEVTPKNIRLRKMFLKEYERRRAGQL
ncbi:MAG: translational GTPase TypA [Patescibacteria group bacterium]|nr:translational GTPase TypA [Patescibacteria group bacterium]